MIVIPAIDLLDERCVRLAQGDYGAAVRYSGDPAEIARAFEAAGARRIHLVDLDAAKGGGRNNRRLLERIRRAVACTLEVGGGIRGEADVRELLDLGVDRLILGTVLAKDPETVGRWAERWAGKFIAGIDARDGLVKVAGWREGSDLADVALAKTAAGLGCVAIIYTNIARDGMLSGPDIERTNLIARTAKIPVILSGGIGSERDIDAAAEGRDPLVVAAITGKAVYEGKLDLAALLKRLPQDSASNAVW